MSLIIHNKMLGREAVNFQKTLIALHGMESGHLDRQAVEKLFGMRQRRARQIIRDLPGLRAGNVSAVPRLALIARLEETASGGVFQSEVNRRPRVVEELDRTPAPARGAAGRLRGTGLRKPLIAALKRRGICSTFSLIQGEAVLAGSRTPRRARPVETLIGRRVKERRVFLGMSQTVLAHKIGVSLQQLQKYEKGANRIAFSRMLRVAAALKVDITYFSEGVAGRSNVHRGDAPVLPRDCVQLVRAYSRIRNRKFQTQALAMVKALAKAC